MTRKQYPMSNLPPESTPWGRALQQEATDLRVLVDRLATTTNNANLGAQSVLSSSASTAANPTLQLALATITSADAFGILLTVGGAEFRAVNGTPADYAVNQQVYVLLGPSLDGALLVNLPSPAPSSAVIGAAVGGMLTAGDVTGVYDSTAGTITLSLGSGVIVQADLSSALLTYLMNRANLTGTQTASTISDFTAAARIAAQTDAAAGTASMRTLGTGALQAVSGTDARLSDTRTPGALSVTNAMVAAAAAISADKLANGTTNVVMLATERTKLTGIATGATANSTDATLLNRANHTGTQLRSTISDFAAATLNVFAAPTAAVPFNNQKITGLAPGVASTDAATVGQVTASTAPDTGWITATGYQNTWVAYTGAPWTSSTYRKIGAWVYLGGVASRSAAAVNGEAIYTLPAGYRPTIQVEVPVQIGGGTYTCVVDVNGNVQVGNFGGQAAINIVFMGSFPV